MSTEQFGDMRTEYSKALVAVGEEDPNVVVLGADTTDSLKTANFGKKFPERFFNVGIAEANLVSVAAGLAYSGKTAFASTYAIFLPGRCVDQIRNAIAYPSPGDKKGLNVKLVVSHGGLSVGADGGSHQQIEDIAIMRAIPNMRVLVPSDSVMVSKLTWIIAQQYGPFYMRMARSKTPIIHTDSQEFQIGKGIVLRDGSDCTIAACGITVGQVLQGVSPCPLSISSSSSGAIVCSAGAGKSGFAIPNTDIQPELLDFHVVYVPFSPISSKIAVSWADSDADVTP